MKLFKYSILAISAAVASMAFTSCDGDKAPDYEPGNPGVGVYFPSTDAATLEVTNSTTSIPVVVERNGETGAASYSVVAKTDAPEGVFTLPTSVSFGQGETTTNLMVPCNLTEARPGTSYQLEFALGSDVPSFNYGTNTYTLTVSLPEAWSEWVKYDQGICTWVYELNFIGSGPDPDLPIFYRVNSEDSNRWQFRIDNWAYNVPLVIDYDAATGICHIPFGTPTGATINVSGMGTLPVFCTDLYTLEQAVGQVDPDDEGASFFNKETGLFEIAIAYYVIRTDNGQPGWFEDSLGYETCQVGEYKDYTASLTYEGVFTSLSTETFAQFSANVGADCSEAKVMISNALSAQEILNAIMAGSEDAVSVAPGENQSVRVPVYESGEYIGVIASFNGEESKNASAIKFTVTLGSNVDPEDANWVKMSTGIIVDGWFTAAWQFQTRDGQIVTYESLPWTFEMQKHKTEAGLYRMKAPYTSNADECVLVYNEINKNVVPYNIVIDAKNPQVVKIVPQISGFASPENAYNLSAEEGYMSLIADIPGFLSSQYGWTDEQILAEHADITSYLEDGIIVCPQPLWGSSADFGHYWREAVSMIALDANMGQSSAPLKKLDNMLNLRAKAKVKGMLKLGKFDVKKAKATLKFTNSLDKKMLVRVK